jgi:chromosome segregation ATPase
MQAAKRQINNDKHQRVAAVIDQITEQGRDDDLKTTIIARRAGVHRSFVANHFAAQITRATTEIQARFVAGLNGQTALSAASLRVEMETAKQQARAAHDEVRRLKERLARTIGDEVSDIHPEHGACATAVNDLQAQVDRLLASEIDLRRQLRETSEELDAARALNRTLIREHNSPTS